MSEDVSRISELRKALSAVDRSAFLVEARVIRRVIRDRYGMTNLAIELPHTQCLVVSSEDIRKLTHPDELGLQSFASLSERCILVCEPAPGELDHWPLEELKQKLWRQLFHGTLDRELSQLLPPENRELLLSNIAAIGQVEFDEAHYVLKTEHRLMIPASRNEALRELVAIYFEFRCFEPDLLPTWFPSMYRVPNVERILSQGLDIDRIFRQTRVDNAPSPELKSHSESDEDRLKSTRRNWSLGLGVIQSDRGYLWQLRLRDRAHERGNTVYAITCAIRASQRANSDSKRESARNKAQEDVRRLVSRLRNAIAFPKRDTDNWQAALWALAENSVHGFWNKEKRLLYDLQKVCLDHERLTYRVDLVKWIVTRGQRPLRRPLNNVREVAMAKHLASAASRLAYVRLSGSDRDRLTDLIENAAHLSESQMRDRMRPAIKQTLLNVQLVPKSVPEQVAFDKVVEESIDCIADRGYLTMGYLRDVISKNDLKLPDLQELREVWYGDQLLRTDDQLDLTLDGVYRRGEFYLRWLQVVSSFFFGTRLGRFATMYLIIPFGGAVVIVEGAMHVVHIFQHKSTKHVLDSSVSHDDAEESDNTNTNPIDSLANNSTPNTENSTPLSNDTPSDPTAEKKPNDLAEDGTTFTMFPDSTDPIVQVPPKTTDQAVNQILTRQTDTLWLVLLLGFLLMGLIHVPSFRQFCFGWIKTLWNFTRKVLFEAPLRLLSLPILKHLWNSLPFVRFRRFILVPSMVAILFCRWLPWLVGWESASWFWVGLIAVISSLVLNSRIGRDAQEVTRDWMLYALHQLQAHFILALIGWVFDIFRFLLNTLERVLYAVDEWLRFHSDENWLSIVIKAILGVIWTLVSFLIRIYVNLLIEPTFHPVKHFPVVTVAHKIFLPALIMLEGNMVHFLGQYVGTPLARSITWFNIFFLPGFFGFAVWELKENWRLYFANRKDRLLPVSVGSHGETIARLLRPGFHSGTLPKIYRKLRRLEHQDASLRRFTSRRSTREQLLHVEHAIQSFVSRELISLLQRCSVWEAYPLRCSNVEASTNSFSIELECPKLGPSALVMRFQEQSSWIVASIAQLGWLRATSDAQWNSFGHALVGFYRKCGIDLVREQIEIEFTKQYPYDIDSRGLLVWPSKRFDVEIVSDLKGTSKIYPLPVSLAAQSNLQPIERERVIFGATQTRWKDWDVLWNTEDVPPKLTSVHMPPACELGPLAPLVVAVRHKFAGGTEL